MSDEDSKAVLREELRERDVPEVRRLVEATGFFTQAETDIAVELLEETLARGEESGYRFVFLERAGQLVGYSCYGEIPCTVGSFDLYWIVTDPRQQGRGFGRRLLERTEANALRLGGRMLYADTSGRAQYEPTRCFYEATGFRCEARFPDFYAPGDDKIVYAKPLAARGGRAA